MAGRAEVFFVLAIDADANTADLIPLNDPAYVEERVPFNKLSRTMRNANLSKHEYRVDHFRTGSVPVLPDGESILSVMNMGSLYFLSRTTGQPKPLLLCNRDRVTIEPARHA